MSLIYNIESCENVQLSDIPVLPNEYDLIELLKTDYNTNENHLLRKYTIEYSENCCDNNSVDISVNYKFISNMVSYTSDSEFGIYLLKLSGISGGFVSSVMISHNNPNNYIPIQFNKHIDGISYSIRYPIPEITIPNSLPNQPLNTVLKVFYIKFVTIDNFEYVVKIDMTITEPGRGNVTNIVTNLIYRPPLPSNVVIDTNNNLNINMLFENGEELFSQIYNVIICRWRKEDNQVNPNVNSFCKQKSVFLDCNIECLLVDKLIRCPDTNVFHLYDALKYSNDCDTLTEDKCALFETLIRKLSGPDCSDPNDDCECKDCEPRRGAYPNNFRNNLGIVKQKYKECGHCGTNRRR